MKLTARQALEIGLELWEWEEDNPDKEKHEWPEWEKYGQIEACCPLCEYLGWKPCSKCLIYWRKEPGLDNHCTHYDSPFEEWVNARTLRSRKFWAGKVAKLHREALERLEG